MALFDRVTIVGLGLIGGSLGLAIKRRRLARRVIGVSRRASTLRQAKARRAIDEGTTDWRRAVCDADLVVIATPVDTIVAHARRLARHMKPGGVLTDVGSTKAGVVREIERSIPRRIAYVGAHPIAGSEQRGIAAADSALFAGAACVLTKTSRTNRQALQRLARLWRALGSDVLILNPSAHDRLLAATSHLPHALAYCLANAVTLAPLRHAPPSLLDMTRIAKSDPELWDDILLSNRKELLAAMARFERSWRALRSYVRSGQRAALRRFLTKAQIKRLELERS